MSREIEFLKQAVEALELMAEASAKLDLPALTYLIRIARDQAADDLRGIQKAEASKLRLVRKGKE